MGRLSINPAVTLEMVPRYWIKTQKMVVSLLRLLPLPSSSTSNLTTSIFAFSIMKINKLLIPMSLRRHRRNYKSLRTKDLLKSKKIIQRIHPKQSSQAIFTMVLGKKKETQMKMHRAFWIIKITLEEASLVAPSILIAHLTQITRWTLEICTINGWVQWKEENSSLCRIWRVLEVARKSKNKMRLCHSLMSLLVRI